MDRVGRLAVVVERVQRPPSPSRRASSAARAIARIAASAAARLHAASGSGSCACGVVQHPATYRDGSNVRSL